MHQEKPKIIFITISRGGIARNILQNDFFSLVKKEFDKVIILSPAYQDARFIKEFKSEKVETIPLPEVKLTFFSSLITNLNRYLIYNKTSIRSNLYIYLKPPSPTRFKIKFLKYLAMRSVFYPISKIKIVRKILRKIDCLTLQKNAVVEYRKLIKKYQPSIIFATNIVEDEDVVLIRAAKKEGVLNIAMAKSWDNLSKRYFRSKANKVIVWSDFMKDQTKRLQDYKEKEIEIVGVPQFDYYVDEKEIINRKDFCNELGLDPSKKIIFFGSEGKLTPSDSNIAEILFNFINNKELSENCQLLIRPHYGYKKDELKFKNLFGKQNVIIDRSFKKSSDFRDQWDYSKKQMNHFLNVMFHSDVIITTCSTLVLDAAALQKTSIIIKFNGVEKVPLYKSVKRLYTCDHFDKILKFKAVLEANNSKELKNLINKSLANQNLLNKERKELTDYFCFKVDGNSGKRLFDVINNYCEEKI